MFAERLAARERDAARDAEERQAAIRDALAARLPGELVAMIIVRAARAARAWVYAPPLRAQKVAPLRRDGLLAATGERLMVSDGPPSGFAYRLLLAPDTLMSEGRVPCGCVRTNTLGFVRYEGPAAVNAYGGEGKRLTVNLECPPEGRHLAAWIMRAGPDGRGRALADEWLSEGFPGVVRVATVEGLVLEVRWAPPEAAAPGAPQKPPPQPKAAAPLAPKPRAVRRL